MIYNQELSVLPDLSTLFTLLVPLPLGLSCPSILPTFCLYSKTRASEARIMAIRIGLIGLSAKAKTSWASSAYLPYLQASGGKFVITALCNSSITAAQSTIEAYKLPANTKAYGDPQSLAEDPEV